MWDWNSIQTVGAWDHGLKIAAVVSVVLATLLGVAFQFYTGPRLKELEQAPRRLTDRQRDALIRTLSTFPGTKIKIQCSASDVEASQFAGDFTKVFRQAGWKVELARIPFGGQPNWIPLGISMEVRYHDKEPEGTLPLIEALRKIGIEPDIEWRSRYADPGLESIEFRIGQK